jgi:hypothetical protein
MKEAASAGGLSSYMSDSLKDRHEPFNEVGRPIIFAGTVEPSGFDLVPIFLDYESWLR